jgi:hypothetical protein
VRLITLPLSALLCGIASLPLFISTAHGQTDMQNTKRRDDWLEANARRGARRDSGIDQNSPLLQKSVRDDFRQLQVVNNELMKRAFTQPSNNQEPISRKEIRSSLDEIHKRARRLQVNLKFPEVKTDKDEKDETVLEKGMLFSGLLKLDQKVMDFVNNPIFRQVKVLDTQLSNSASRDLKEILRITEVLRKEARQE